MTQNEQILTHIKEYGSITTMEAFRSYGITRLSGRIFELRKTHKIVGTMETNDNGKQYVRYTLEDE